MNPFSILMIFWCIFCLIYGVVGVFVTWDLEKSMRRFEKMRELEDEPDLIYLNNGFWIRKRGKKVE